MVADDVAEDWEAVDKEFLYEEKGGGVAGMGRGRKRDQEREEEGEGR